MTKVYAVVSECYEDGLGCPIIPHIFKLFKKKKDAEDCLDEAMRNDEADQSIEITSKEWIKGEFWRMTYRRPHLYDGKYEYKIELRVSEHIVEG